MAQRGRRSAAALSVVAKLPGQRLAPPRDLPEAQARVWKRVVASRPADWFDGGSLVTLTAFVRHAADLDRISGLIDAIQPDHLATSQGLGRYRRLLAMRARETAAIIGTARQLRLNPQALMHPRTAGTAVRSVGADPGARKPWEFGGED